MQTFGVTKIFAALGFDEHGRILLLKNKDGLYAPPHWKLSPIDGLKLTNEILIPAYIKNNLKKQGIEITKEIQPLPAWYLVPRAGYWTLGIIIGRIGAPPSNKDYKYVSPEDLLCFAKQDLLVDDFGGAIHVLCLRALASRDNPNETYMETAGNDLRELQEIQKSAQ